MIALLAVYPDGRYGHRYERRLVRAVAGLAVAVPIVLLLARPTLQPAWVFAWGAETGDARAASRRSPARSTSARSRSSARPLRAYLEAALALAPLVGAIVIGLRYRRLRAAQRVQIRWPLYGVLVGPRGARGDAARGVRASCPRPSPSRS